MRPLTELYAATDRIGFELRMRIDVAQAYDGAFSRVYGIHASTL